MKVGWLQDDPGYIGGAELSAAEFREAAPDDVEIVDCPPKGIDYDCDRYVAHNVWTYHLEDVEPIQAPLTKYCHDVWRHSRPGVKDWFFDNASLIFCSELQRDYMKQEGEVIPPALDLTRFKAPRQSRKRREGTCCIAQWRNPGKGGFQVAEYARDKTVDVYGPGPFQPQGPGIRYHGPLEPAKIPQTLWQHSEFVFLPFEIEPFCRTVAEADAAGCDVVTNGLVGAAEYKDNPEALENAAQRFWEVVCSS